MSRGGVTPPLLKVGDKAPAINLLASNGKTVSLNDFSGRNIVLYFYPKDDTPGCTVEACGFRDEIKSMEGKNAVVLGVSPDGVKSHEKFIEKFKLPFLLLADEEKKLCRDYGVWAKKSMYGRDYMGVARTTFIIDKTGKIAKIFEKVKPQDHTAEVLTVLKELN
ncbi:MAG TPA: thioredoxin-dependent thiol peroxidase [Candidatus Omnitrophota bacterium]|nr:thioredoxin-dependent thiol peroxidase [Candidatus Omnitrophota bacterium]